MSIFADLPLHRFPVEVIARGEVAPGVASNVRVSLTDLAVAVKGQLGPNYATLANLNADLNWGADVLGFVWGDGTPANNGVYKKSGAAGAGSWTKIGDIPGVEALEADIASLQAADINLLTADAALDSRLDALEPLAVSHTAQISALQAVDAGFTAEFATLKGAEAAPAFFSSLVSMNASLNSAAGRFALVMDQNADYVDTYQKAGVSGAGSWQFLHRKHFNSDAPLSLFERVIEGVLRKPKILIHYSAGIYWNGKIRSLDEVVTCTRASTHWCEVTPRKWQEFAANTVAVGFRGASIWTTTQNIVDFARDLRVERLIGVTGAGGTINDGDLVTSSGGATGIYIAEYTTGPSVYLRDCNFGGGNFPVAGTISGGTGWTRTIATDTPIWQRLNIASVTRDRPGFDGVENRGSRVKFSAANGRIFQVGNYNTGADDRTISAFFTPEIVTGTIRMSIDGFATNKSVDFEGNLQTVMNSLSMENLTTGVNINYGFEGTAANDEVVIDCAQNDNVAFLTPPNPSSGIAAVTRNTDFIDWKFLLSAALPNVTRWTMIERYTPMADRGGHTSLQLDNNSATRGQNRLTFNAQGGVGADPVAPEPYNIGVSPFVNNVGFGIDPLVFHYGNRASAFTADPATDIITHPGLVVPSLTRVHLSSTGDVQGPPSTTTLPGGLNFETAYFIIKITETTSKLATSYANAIAGSAIDITSTGTGGATHTIEAFIEGGVVVFGNVFDMSDSYLHNNANGEPNTRAEPTIKVSTDFPSDSTFVRDGYSVVGTGNVTGTPINGFKEYTAFYDGKASDRITLGGPDGELEKACKE